ncbi:MAG: type IV toxin-antitoxin system AbiEi family antitoxin domain-containing protein [Firmicutes bacterium]|nr:type IV toxin-antitoxin system AbiEi family antitoxin domain-containing protein [Bacillota bacterium]
MKSILPLLYVYVKINTNIKDKGGDRMLDKAFVMNLLKENNGIVESKQLTEAGIDSKILQRLEQSGEIERVGRGLYSDPNHMADDYLVTQYRCKKGIYSHETALFLHE